MFQKLSLLIGVVSSGVALANDVTITPDRNNCNKTPENDKNGCKITFTLKNDYGKEIGNLIALRPAPQDGWSYVSGESTCKSTLKNGSSCAYVYVYRPTDATLPSGTLTGNFSYRPSDKQEDFKIGISIPYSKKGVSPDIKSTFSPTQCENTEPHSQCHVSLTFTKEPGAGEITHLKLKSLNGKDSSNGWAITSQGECAKVDEQPSTCQQILSFKPTNENMLPSSLVVEFGYSVDGTPVEEPSQTQALPYSVNTPAVIGKFYNDEDREISSIVGTLKKPETITLKLKKSDQYKTDLQQIGAASIDAGKYPEWTLKQPGNTACKDSLNKGNTCDITLTLAGKNAHGTKPKDLIITGLGYRFTGEPKDSYPKINPLPYSYTSDILKWTTDLHAPVMANPIISHNTDRDGHIFVGTTNKIDEIEDRTTAPNITPAFTTYGSFCEGPYPECPETPLIFPKEGAMQYLYVPTSNGLNIFMPDSQHPLRFIPEHASGLKTTSPVFMGDDMYFATSSTSNEGKENKLDLWSKIFKSKKDGTDLKELQYDGNGISILPDIAQTSVEGDEGDDPLFGGGTSKTLYFGTSDGKLHGLNTLDSTCPVWFNGNSIQIAEPKTPVVPPASINSPLSKPTLTSDGTIYIGDLEGKLTKISPDGTEKTLFDCTKTIVNCKIITKPTVGADGTIYVGTYAGGTSVYAIDPKSTNPQNFKWKFTTGGGIISTPVLADGILFVTSTDRTLYALNAKTGVELWEFSTGNSLYTSPVVNTENTTVYFGDNANPGGGAPAGFFYALDYSKGPQP